MREVELVLKMRTLAEQGAFSKLMLATKSAPRPVSKTAVTSPRIRPRSRILSDAKGRCVAGIAVRVWRPKMTGE